MVIVKANKNRREKDKAECCALCKTKTCRVCTLTTRQSHAKAKAKACPLICAQSQVVALLIHFQLFKGKSGSPSPSRSRSHSVSLPPSRLPAHLPGDLGRPGFTWRFRLKTGAGLVSSTFRNHLPSTDKGFRGRGFKSHHLQIFYSQFLNQSSENFPSVIRVKLYE